MPYNEILVPLGELTEYKKTHTKQHNNRRTSLKMWLIFFISALFLCGNYQKLIAVATFAINIFLTLYLLSHVLNLN